MAELEKERQAVWDYADEIAEPPSDRKSYVERVAWALHLTADRSGSPRQAWADLPDHRRAMLYAQARGAISVCEAALLLHRMEYRRQFGGGIIPFDSACLDALRDGVTGSDAWVKGADALLDAFVEYVTSDTGERR